MLPAADPGRRAAGPGADPAVRAGHQRHPPLDPPGPGVVPARRAGQARARPLPGGVPRADGARRARTTSGAALAAAAAGGGAAGRARAGAARPRQLPDAARLDLRACCSWPGGRVAPPGAGSCWPRCRCWRWRSGWRRTGCGASSRSSIPWSDPRGSGFQIIQSWLAFGNGGIFGQGIGGSRQKLFYLPESHTDFIFAIVGEELGFIGAVAVVGALRRADLARPPGRAARARPVRRVPGARHHRAHRDPDAREPRRGDRPAADEGPAAAVHLLRRLGPAGHDARRRACCSTSRSTPMFKRYQPHPLRRASAASACPASPRSC